MLTDFFRDHLFTVAWYGLMGVVWLGWSQEDPPKRLRLFLGIGSVMALGLAILFGIILAGNWDQPSALDRNLVGFIIVVWAEIIACAAGAIFLAVKKRGRWIAWWIALVVAVHFIPLGVILADWSHVVLGVALAIAIILVRRPLAQREGPTSALVGPIMGFSLLAFALVSALVVLPQL